MQVREATIIRIRELLKRERLTLYALAYKTGMPTSTLKCIINGRSKNPGIVNIQKIAEGFNMSIREFYDSELFDNLDQED
ncbi:helix-turn-helix domain-containing protein [Otoolea muris]|jgi:transcriptional regulator with XRE-family HTH domain|uniref:helix-turn-helix domain-containing protein n=1 Tax=Otoolea muris TaxID=2941515 RepID=UPI0013622010|nr:helix-turn-helix transcriptional regulator [Otoolea muris]MCI9583520.1 helix-turn-helix transcriptional regulator [Clostridium sp.]NBI70737.1 XRE family transcriptional regulator [Clostridiaceae bacterium]